MREPSISAIAVRSLVDLAVSMGADRNVLLANAGISASSLDGADARIPFDRYVSVTREAQSLCHDPAFALRYGEMIDVSDISISCAVASATGVTIDGVIGQINRFARLGADVECADNGDRLQLKRVAGQLWLVDTRRNPNDFPELTEATFARMITSTRRALGEMPFFLAVEFTHASPAYHAEYERIFRIPMTFGAKRNAFCLDERLLRAHRPRPSSPLVTRVLREHAERLLERLDATQTVRGRVESEILSLLGKGDASIDAVSRSLALSRQTVFRGLKAEGVTFEAVLDQVRHRLAIRHLRDEGLPVYRVSQLLGYSEPAAFSRAFKRWTGTSPRAMRGSRG